MLMNTSKKSLLALLLTSMVTIGLAGCSQSTDSAKPATTTTATNSNTNLQLNNNQSTTDQAKKDGQNQTAVQDPNANEAAIVEVRKTFNIGADYITITMPSIPGIAMGKFQQITLDNDKQRLALAKALTSATVNSGWEQGAPDPGMFVSNDGATFMVGMKKSNGDFTLETFKLQTDNTYKSVNKETKKASN
jgi:hypothetical protein